MQARSVELLSAEVDRLRAEVARLNILLVEICVMATSNGLGDVLDIIEKRTGSK